MAKLPSTVNNTATERAVLAAARVKFGRSKRVEMVAFYDHGHWWLKRDGDHFDRAEMYSVHDERDGFCFEQV